MLTQVLANFFFKGPNNHFSLCRPWGLCHHKGQVDKWALRCSNKALFAKTAKKADQSADTCSILSGNLCLLTSQLRCLLFHLSLFISKHLPKQYSAAAPTQPQHYPGHSTRLEIKVPFIQTSSNCQLYILRIQIKTKSPFKGRNLQEKEMGQNTGKCKVL